MKTLLYILIGMAIGMLFISVVFKHNIERIFGAQTLEDTGTHYKLEMTSDIPQKERVEIRKDKAQADLIFWDDEEKISIIPQIPSASLGSTRRDFNVSARRPAFSQRVEFKSGDVTAFVEPRSDNEFDIDFTLDKKPGTNVFTYVIDGADNFDFFYQPALTQDEKDEGAERPENVVGSYAVYHKTKANHRVGSTNYATGKAFHIYRPKAIDANDNETWAELAYENGVLSVTVPQSFLDNAKYPVVVDPTFGYTTLGASTTNIAFTTNSSVRRRGHAISFTEGGTLDSISAGMSSLSTTNTVDTTFFMNDEDSAGTGSHGEIASGEQTDLSIETTAAFKTINMASQSFVADTFILSLASDPADLDGTNVRVVFDDSGSRNHYSEQVSGAGAYSTVVSEDPWTEDSATLDDLYSIYATYTAEEEAQSGVIQFGDGQINFGDGELIFY